MESPVSLGKVLRFGSLLVAIQIFGTVATRRLGNTGLVLVSILGATVSSASTTAAAANLSAHGHASQAIVAAVATSIMSTMMNLPATLPATENKTCISPCFFWRQLYNSLQESPQFSAKTWRSANFCDSHATTPSVDQRLSCTARRLPRAGFPTSWSVLLQFQSFRSPLARRGRVLWTSSGSMKGMPQGGIPANALKRGAIDGHDQYTTILQ